MLKHKSSAELVNASIIIINIQESLNLSFKVQKDLYGIISCQYNNNQMSHKMLKPIKLMTINNVKGKLNCSDLIFYNDHN